jgi:Leucine-rich repeat (LRR) protein
MRRARHGELLGIPARWLGLLALGAALGVALGMAPVAHARTVDIPDHDALVRLLLGPHVPGARYRIAPALAARGELDAEWLRIRNRALLAQLGFVRTLSLRRATVGSFAFLSRMPRLERVDLSRTVIRSLAPLGRASTLRELDLADTSVTDLTPLAGLAGLEELDLSGTRVTDLTPLRGRGLIRLTLGRAGPWALPDLRPLGAVTTLTLRHAPAGLDLAPLRALRLAELVLDGTAVRNIAALAAHPTLTRLSLRHTGVPVASVRALLGRSPGLRVVMPDGRVVGRVVVWRRVAPDPADTPCLVGQGECTREAFGPRLVPSHRFVMP